MLDDDKPLSSLGPADVDQINIFYIHAPDPLTPLSELLAGIQAFYETGGFKKFGLSNFDHEGIQAVYDHCKAHDYVLPTVHANLCCPLLALP